LIDDLFDEKEENEVLAKRPSRLITCADLCQTLAPTA
jgi:hypothetical protein